MYTATTASVACFVHRSPALQKPPTTGFQTNTPLVNPLLLDDAHLSEAISKFPFWFSTDAFSHLTSQLLRLFLPSGRRFLPFSWSKP
jgi:hypothetical protein